MKEISIIYGQGIGDFLIYSEYIKKLCQSGKWHRNKWSYIL